VQRDVSAQEVVREEPGDRWLLVGLALSEFCIIFD
jgi:hypothetical protein